MVLAGNYLDLPAQGWKAWIPNTTPDVETGTGAWTDDQIIRAMRDGIGKNDNLLFPIMPFDSYQNMSDEDVRAIVAYLRTIPPVRNPRPIKKNQFGFIMDFLLNRGVAHHVPVVHVSPPDKNDKVKYGQYVLNLGHCAECHSTNGMGAVAFGKPGYLSGFQEPDEILLPFIGKVYMRNLTPDVETGLGKYSAEQIKQAIKTGKRLDGKTMAPPMSMFIPHFSGIAEEDLDALVVFLKAIPAVVKKIPEREFLTEFEKTLH